MATARLHRAAQLRAQKVGRRRQRGARIRWREPRNCAPFGSKPPDKTAPPSVANMPKRLDARRFRALPSRAGPPPATAPQGS
jgi:hypothetical protein